MAIPNVYSYYGVNTEQLRVNYDTTTIRLRMNYEKTTVVCITDGK